MIDWRATSLRAHAQTITAAVPLRRPLPRGTRSELVDIAFDDGTLVAACTWLPHAAPAVIVIHGTSGSSEDAYVVRASRALVRAGFHAVRLNQRGSGLGQGRAKRLYHGGLGEDLDVAARFIAAQPDVTSVGALGFSLGGAVSLSHVAAGAPSVVRAVATISAPVAFAENALHFEQQRRGFTGVYERLMLRSLLERARALRVFHPAVPVNAAALERATTIAEWDEAVTVPCHGFRDVADYHARASVGPHLGRIDVPTLIIHAEDDPVVPARALREAVWAAGRNPALDVVVMPGGGHVGFVESLAHLWDASAAVARAVEHFRRHLPQEIA